MMNILLASAVAVVMVYCFHELYQVMRIVCSKELFEEWKAQNYFPRNRLCWSKEKGFYSKYC